MRATVKALLGAIATLVAFAAGAHAGDAGQESEGQKGLQARIKIGETILSCRDFRGQSVRAIHMEDLGDVAHARVINRMPIITLNQSRMETLPEKLQIFFFNHECGHHVMGHIYYPTATSENEADCWSIKLGRREGHFARKDVEEFAPHLARSRGSPFGHLPGPQRAARLLACFDDPSEDSVAEPAGYLPPPSPLLAEGVR